MSVSSPVCAPVHRHIVFDSPFSSRHDIVLPLLQRHIQRCYKRLRTVEAGRVRL